MRLWLAAAAGCAALVACTQATPRETAKTPARVQLPPPVDAAYAGFWAVWQEANASLEFDSRRLSEHVADPLLQTLQANLAGTRARKQVSRGQVTHQILGMEVDGDARRITDCVGLGDWRLFDAATGAPLPGQLSSRRTQLTVLVLRPAGSTWKATNMYVSGEC